MFYDVVILIMLCITTLYSDIIACYTVAVRCGCRRLCEVLPDALLEQLLKRSLEQAVAAVSDLYACPTPNCSFRVALEAATSL